MHPLEELIRQDPVDILDEIQNKYTLKCMDYLIRIMECEYYPWEGMHTHRNERQREFGKIYIHRTTQDYNGSYKSGSYKGMDITCFRGILIRSIQVYERQEVDGKCKIISISDIIEGPSCVVDYLCNLSGYSLPELENNLSIRKLTWPYKEPILGCRVGLTLKRADDLEKWVKELLNPWRSSIYIPKKDRKSFFALNPKRTDITFPAKDRWLQEINQGKVPELSKHMSLLHVVGYYQQ